MKLSGSWKPSPDGQWRLLFALSRFGGLRCPSEHLALRWSDVDWERGRMTVQSPKTEYHPGGESQIIPLFPELRPHLEAAWEMAEPGTVHVITRYRDANANLRTQLLRIIRRAGLKPWPKLFANLRSTRETELAESFPIHVVCEWIGNSQAVAAKHYLQVTDEHFGKAVQNPVQQTAELARKAQKPDTAAHKKTPVLQGSATLCTSVQWRIRDSNPRPSGCQTDQKPR
jgi:integrase